jgi:hypothetical protein
VTQVDRSLTRGLIDLYGVSWSDQSQGFCSGCQQPLPAGGENQENQECDHVPLPWNKIVLLLGGVPVGDGSTLRPLGEVERYQLAHRRKRTITPSNPIVQCGEEAREDKETVEEDLINTRKARRTKVRDRTEALREEVNSVVESAEATAA